MVSESTKQTAQEIKNRISENGISHKYLLDLLDVAVNAFEEEKDEKWALKVTKYIKECCEIGIQNGIEVLQLDELYWRTMKEEAPYYFESFLIYMERHRPFKKKFYEPRKKALKIVADDLQDLEDGVIEFYGLSMPPRVGKSTICIFFFAWIIGKRPDSHNAMSGHSGLLADGFYTEILNLTTSKEYTFSEIFPNVTIESKHADKNEVNFNTPDRFPSLTCRGIDGTWTGEVDISEDGYLYVDDLVRDRKESLSPRRLENRYQDYLNVLVDRKNDGTKELMVGTRWNVLDPLGQVEKQNKNDPNYRFRKIPALNEKGESNFDYPVKGFSTRHYRKMKKKLDKNEWEAKFQQNPFVREGLLYPEDDLRHYNGVLPEGDHRVISACDVAWGGGDSLSMPIGYEYANGDVYIPDWIFNKGKKEVTLPLVIGKIMGEGIRQICFEANNGGDMYKKYVDEKLQEQGYKCSCTDRKAPGNMEKLSKIIAYSGYIIQHFVFLDEDKQSQEYSDAMDELLMFVQIGQNEHDDAADGLTQLAMAIEGGDLASVQVQPRRF